LSLSAAVVPAAGWAKSTVAGDAATEMQRYYQPRPTSADEPDLLNRLDEIFTEHPVYGSRRLQVMLLGVAARFVQNCTLRENYPLPRKATANR
jgi:hypothetical protein